MAKQFGSQIDLQKIPVIGLVAEQKSTAPTLPNNGQLWYDLTANATKCYDNGAWVVIGNVAGGSTPVGAAGGDLGGNYPNPTVVKAQIGFLAPNTISIGLSGAAEAYQARITGDTQPRLQITNGGILRFGDGTQVTGDTNLYRPAVPDTLRTDDSFQVGGTLTVTGQVNLTNQKITGVLDPTAATDAATKNYVDAFAQGIDTKASVRLASDGINYTLSGQGGTYNPPDGFSGQVPVTGDRVLVKDQSTPANNGIYIVAAGAWTRATDLDAWAEVPGAFVFVEDGNLADTGWVCTANAGGTLGTTAMPWTQFSGAGTYKNGAGLALTGTTFSIATGGVTSNMVQDNELTATDVNSVYKDGVAGTPSMRTLGAGAQQAAAGNDARLSDSRAPNGVAGGYLGGSYPNPSIAPQVVAAANMVLATLTDAQVNAANKDGSAAVPSMRTLGTGANQAASGADSRFTDARAPSGAAGGDLAGSTYPNPVIANLAVTAAKIANSTITDTQVAAANKDGATGTASMRTLGPSPQQAMPGNTRLDTITAPIGVVGMNSQRLTNLGAPVSGGDAVNKIYVDGLVSGLDIKASVRAMGAVVNLGTYNASNDGSTSSMTGMPSNVDGVTMASQDRVLLTNQNANPKSNGIWVISTLGTGVNGVWNRPQDFGADLTGSRTPTAGSFTFVEQGTTYADTGWVLTSDNPITVDGASGSNLVWAQFSGAGQVIAGTGLTKTGNSIDVIAASSGGLQVGADDISLKPMPSGGLATQAAGAYVALQIPNPGLTIDGTGVGVLLAAGGGITKNINGLLIDTSVVTRKFAGSCPALTAGVEANVTHNLGTKDVLVNFRNTSDFEVVLQWRAVDVNTIGITADVAYGAAALRAVVMG